METPLGPVLETSYPSPSHSASSGQAAKVKLGAKHSQRGVVVQVIKKPPLELSVTSGGAENRLILLSVYEIGQIIKIVGAIEGVIKPILSSKFLVCKPDQYDVIPIPASPDNFRDRKSVV